MPLTSIPSLAGDLAAMADRLRTQTVALLVGGRGDAWRAGPGAFRGHGSGIVWRSDGLIVTNAHVARGDRLTAILPDGRSVPTRVVARDPSRDLALVRAESDGLTPATPGDPDALRPGQIVLAFGHPFGHANALAVGIVHGVSAPRTRHPSGRYSRERPSVQLIRADVRLLPGNSGGPLADAAGRVLGVNTMIAGGLGVAVSVGEVAALVAAWDAARVGTPHTRAA